MKRFSFKMKLLPDYQEEYHKRHNDIWPELSALLKEAGIKNYSIFLDEETLILFACLEAPGEHVLEMLAKQPLMQQWWQYMKDIMETNEDGSPVSVPLKQVFYLP